MGCGEGTGEGLGIGTGVGMGVGNDKVGRGVGNGVGCEGGQDMGLAMTGRLPNPIFEGDFHPMPSGWAETKLSSRHGDEEHAVVPQPAAAVCCAFFLFPMSTGWIRIKPGLTPAGSISWSGRRHRPRRQ